MLLAGIQARPELDPRLKHSAVTPLARSLCFDTRQLKAAQSDYQSRPLGLSGAMIESSVTEQPENQE